MKKHMTLIQLLDVYQAPISVFRSVNGVYERVERYLDAQYTQLPVMRIGRDPDGIVAYLGVEIERDDYDLTPTKDNMKSILDEAFGSWFEARKDDLIKDAIVTGDYDDEIIERYLADTEWNSIDEMTECIDELRDKVESMQETLEEIYRYAREYAD